MHTITAKLSIYCKEHNRQLAAAFGIGSERIQIDAERCPECDAEGQGITAEEQNRILALVKDKTFGHGGSDIDGSGCDSGDPIDLTLEEISQGFGCLLERITELEKAVERRRACVSYRGRRICDKPFEMPLIKRPHVAVPVGWFDCSEKTR